MIRKLEYNGKELMAEFDEGFLKINDSWKIVDEKEMLMFLSIASIYQQYDLKVPRRRLLKHWKKSNLLFKLHINREKTGNVVFEEKENKLKLLAKYFIEGWLI